MEIKKLKEMGGYSKEREKRKSNRKEMKETKRKIRRRYMGRTQKGRKLKRIEMKMR